MPKSSEKMSGAWKVNTVLTNPFYKNISKVTKNSNSLKPLKSVKTINTVKLNKTKPDKDSEGSDNSDSEEEHTKKTRFVKIGEALNLIPKFEGTSEVHIDDFISYCKYALELVDPKEKHVLEKLILGRVIGKAATQLRDFRQEKLEQFFNRLKLIHAPTKTYAQLSAELGSVTQLKNESVLEFGSRVTEIHKNLNMSVQETFDKVEIAGLLPGTKKIAIKSFLTGLDNKIDAKIINKNFETLQEAIDAAIIIEREVKEREQRRENNLSTQRTVHHITEHQNTRERSPLNRGFSQLSSQRIDKSNVTCHLCGKPGHYKSNCFLRNNKNYNNRMTQAKFCTFCKREGHIIDECRRKKYYCQQCKVNGHTFDYCPKRSQIDNSKNFQGPRR